MANFALDINSPQGEIISSLNYALVNLGSGSANVGNSLIANPNGSITNSTSGSIISWQYRWINIRYATNATGSAGFSTVPTNATYYGIQNTPDQTPSTVNNPANYTWTQVVNGFGTTKFLFYQTRGGYQIGFYIGVGNPGQGYQQTTNAQAIDLTILTVATGAAGSNGVSASVNPSLVYFPQNADGTYPIGNVLISANFVANTTSVTSSTLYANINTQGNVTIYPISSDPSITLTTFNSNTSANVLTLTFTQSNTGVVATGTVTQQVSFVSNTGISTFNVVAYTLANVFPYTPISNTGSWDFNTGTGTPPYSSGQLLSLTTSDANVVTYANVVNGIPYFTAFPNSYVSGTHTPPSGTISNYGNVYQANLINSGSSTTYVDILMIGGGGDGNWQLVGNTFSKPGGGTYVLEVSSGGSGGNVAVLSNVALTPGTHSVTFARGADTALSYAGNSTVYKIATTGNTGFYNATKAVVAGNGGWVNGVAGNIGTAYDPNDSSGNGRYIGGDGTPDPWGVITWAGQINSNVAYFGGGGAAASNQNYGSLGIPGGKGGGGYGYNPSNHYGTYGNLTTGGGGGGGYGPGGVSVNNYGSPGLIIVRPYNAADAVNWTLTQPNVTLTQQVYSSTALAKTGNTNPTANITNLTWSTPVITSTIPTPQIQITYPQGQYITNNQGVYTPTPVANVVTLTANVQAIRSNSILAAVTQVTRYFTANGGYSITSNTATAYNANALVFSSATTTPYNLYQNVSYSDVGGSTSGFISQALLITTQGNIGANGFIPLAYVISNVDPTTANVSVLNAMYSAPRNAAYPPGPVGVGFPPVVNDVAQFFYPNVSSQTGGITSVQEYDGTTWSPVTAQVISGGLIVTGTITTNQLNANEVWTLQLQSTNATFGNTQSQGFWLASQNGDARFAGNTSIGANLTVGNNAVIAANLSIGSSANIAANLRVGTNANIGNNANIADNLTVGQNANIGNNLFVGTNANIGNNLFVGDNAKINNNLTIGNNLTVGTDASIGGNLSVAGLITAGNLQANTVTTTTIADNSITYPKLGSGVSVNAPFGTLFQSSTSYTLSGTGSYDYQVAGGTYNGFYAKTLAYSEFTPTVAQVNFGVKFKVYFTCNLVASGYPYTSGGETAFMAYTNTGSHGGYNTVNFNSASSVINLNTTGPDSATFNNGGTGSYSGVVVFGNGPYSINSGVGDLATGNFDTIGLVLLNSSGAGSIAITNLVWTVSYQ